MSPPKSYIVLLKEDTHTSTGEHLHWMCEQQPIRIAPSSGITTSLGIAASPGIPAPSGITAPWGIAASLGIAAPFQYAASSVIAAPLGITASARGSGTDNTPGPEIKYQYENIKGYSADLTESALATLNDCDDVEEIVEDTKFIHCADTPADIPPQTNAPWGLQRISQREAVSIPAGLTADALVYQYRPIPPGLENTPVDVYVLDTGVQTDHPDLLGRVTWGWTFPGFPQEEKLEPTTKDVGHGTHVAGIIAGTQFGVAKEANIISVKVLDDNGEALGYSVAAGVDWVIRRVALQRTKGVNRASIINMSLRSETNKAVDRMTNRAVSRGIHVVVAAGNDYERDARDFTPAGLEHVITVGATTIKDEWFGLSNCGPAVNILAPGKGITSADVPSTTRIRDGTSMATAYVTGMIASIISAQGDKPPADLLAELRRSAIPRAVKHVPSKTVNLLLNTGL